VPAACTIIARNYQSYAMVLAESYLRHEPGARFYLLVVDGRPAESAVPEGIHVVTGEELGLPSFYEMAFKYDVTELCTAVKPAFLSMLLNERGEGSVAYLDPDILVLRPLAELKDALRQSDIVLIPHLLDPIPRDGHKPSEQDILIAGAYNLGFLALKAGPEAARLLAWWGARLEDGCRVDPAHGLFVDQRWMDLAPGLFPSTAVLRDATYDVAYWNLFSRPVERGRDGFEVGGRPVAFFHFSGFDPRQPMKLSKHQTRIEVARGSALAELLEVYAGLHERHGHDVCSRRPYGFSQFSNGVPVSIVFRRLFLGLDEGTRTRFGNPFDTAAETSFYQWAVRARPELGGLNPFLDALYKIRGDLPSAFPDPRGASREAFLEWARGPGAHEMGFPPEIVAPASLTGAGLGAVSTAAMPADGVGVNIAGYLRNETGIGAVARGYVAALRSAEVPVALKDFSELSPNRSEDPSLDVFDDVHPHPVNLLCANADQYFVVASHLGEAFLRNRRNIGVWFWELPEFPAEWHDRFPHYDEIWAPTSFIANTLAAVSPIPIVRVPAVLTVEARGDRERGRARLQAASDEFIWLLVFDFHSYFERKNPIALVEAFKQAFRPSDPARLVVKCVNSSFDPDAFASLRAVADGHRVSIYEGYWSLAEMRDLLAACDGYASLHRSEGLGIPLANAMSLGKPVVATGWSGNTDFMTVANSFPVRYELVPLAGNVGPYEAGRVWAEPSVSHAAELLRLVFEGGAAVAARADAARRTIAGHYSVEAVGQAVRDRLEVLASRSPVPREPVPNGTAPAAAPFSAYELRPVLPPLDLHTSQHGLLGRWGKRAANLLVRYHSFHHQRVDGILAGAIGDLASRLATLSDRLDRTSIESREDFERARTMAGSVKARTRELARAFAATAERTSGRFDSVADSVRALGRRLDDELAASQEDMAAARREQESSAEAVGAQLDATTRALCALEARLAEVRHAALVEHDDLATTLRDVQAATEALRAQAGATAPQVQAVHAQLGELAARVAHVGYRFAVRPYMGTDPFGTTGDLDQPMGYGPGTAHPTPSDATFEDLFRGPEALVTERQRHYLPLLAGRQRVVDLGCGRGEFLSLMTAAGIRAVGVEQDVDLVRRCRERRLDVVHGDALAYVRRQRPSTFDAIFSAQFIEHVPPEELPALLALARTRLREGGLFIAETPNPESFEALKAFHVDLTHQRPIYPQVLLYMCLREGFRSARIFYPLGGGFTQKNYESAGEYAVVAVK
jgi:SAM-dependent methyltransferase/glycosyltransferase involved in cell wall biosynthesis